MQNFLGSLGNKLRTFLSIHFLMFYSFPPIILIIIIFLLLRGFFPKRNYYLYYINIYSRFIIVVEHDLSVLDYLSDFICCLYGVPGAYGVVTMPFSVREGKRETVLYIVH